MNVIIEARALRAKSGGVTSYVSHLLKHLRNIENITLDVIDGSKSSSVPLKSELLLPYWMNYKVQSYIAKKKPSLVHFTKAAIPRKKTAPTVVTIYDIIPIFLPETQSFFRRVYWPSALRHAATHADRIITISEKSKIDIMNVSGISADKIVVTPLAIDTNHFSPNQSSNFSSMHDPYILFVGTWDERKNIKALIKAFELIADKIPHQLIIAGRPAHKDDGSRQAAQKSNYNNRITFREYVPYEELPDLYRNADIFVWPSIYEGWGFPPQEAMACGTPVIVSNGGSLPEVVKDCGIVVPFSSDNLHDRTNDFEFIQRLSDEMLNLILNEALKQQYRDKGIIQASRITWTGVAEKTFNVYKEIAL
ncbi:MAG TPA: glycosyltransferase family 1 protein [Candidatus Andersenbacteria bacterium]|nr:glycosyltransferase family 1 protein [Candidatus Andersenbacteria bacterium]